MAQQHEGPDNPQRPLQGIRVLELSQIMAGPTCGLMLADMGAEVIKVERFPEGDIVRNYRKPGDSQIPPAFEILNRGKQSVAIDITAEEGRSVLLKLIETAHVLTENFRPGTLARLGLGYEDVRAVNPRLVYCSIGGYGPHGPMAHKGGFDLILQAYAGIIDATGEPGGRGVKPAISIADVNAGILAVTGILAALLRARSTGLGCRVETSLLQAAVQQTYWFAANYFSAGQLPERLGTAHPLIAPYQTYRCADQEIAIGGGNQANWRRVAEVLGHRDWTGDPRFTDGESRLKHQAELTRLMEQVLATDTAASWIARFDDAGVPAGPVNTVGQALDHAQTRAADMVIDVVRPDGSAARAIGHPVHFDGKNEPVRTAAPRLGEHTMEVLSGLGLSAATVEGLIDAHAVHQAAR